jgi:hypothetical protein
LKKRRRQRGGVASAKISVKTPEQLRWLEAVVEQAQNPGGQGQPVLVLALPGGARVEIGDLKQVALAAALVRALQKPC